MEREFTKQDFNPTLTNGADFICKLNENAKRRPTACALCDDAKLHGQTTPEGNDQRTNRIVSLTNLLLTERKKGSVSASVRH